MKPLLILLFFVLSLSMTNAIIVEELIYNEEVKVDNVFCNAEGILSFRLAPAKQIDVATINGILTRKVGSSQYGPIHGNWDRENFFWNEYNNIQRASFTSEHTQIKNPGNHEVKIFYEINNEDKEIELVFDCPGTEFSCKLFDFRVESCGNFNETFTAVYKIKGLDSYKEFSEIPRYSLDDIKITLVTEEKHCDTEGNCGKNAGIPVNANLEKISEDKLKLTWDYDSAVKNTGITFLPGSRCSKENYDFTYSVEDFTICDPDPFSKEFECNGCELGSVCVLEGDKIIQDGESKYCIDGTLSPQKPTGSYCSSGIECLTNSCIDGVCSDELLPPCDEGIITKACVCGSTEIRVFDNNYCCQGDIQEGECPSFEEEKEITCEEGYFLDGDSCVKIEEKKGFWSSVGNFFKNLFSRR